ncbi:chitin synthase-domain-containing protein [Mycena sp. CBHHK59/15]|nr:chitin synthase-domain-containing protein [Mycena sp. CBHHK59/15]
MARGKDEDGNAIARRVGFKNVKPKPDEAKPKPGLQSQAKPSTSLPLGAAAPAPHAPWPTSPRATGVPADSCPGAKAPTPLTRGTFVDNPCPFPLLNVVPQPPPDYEPFNFPLAHTICLVTAYSESVEGLRTTLDSLATTDYPNSHKLILVIADGMVKGAGNGHRFFAVARTLLLIYNVLPPALMNAGELFGTWVEVLVALSLLPERWVYVHLLLISGESYDPSEEFRGIPGPHRGYPTKAELPSSGVPTQL